MVRARQILHPLNQISLPQLSVSVPELLCPFKLVTARLLGPQSSLRPVFLKGHTLLVKNDLAVYEHRALTVSHKKADHQEVQPISASHCTRLVADAENSYILVSSILRISTCSLPLPALNPCTQMRTHTHTCTHTHTRTQIHTSTHTHTCTHAHSLNGSINISVLQCFSLVRTLGLSHRLVCCSTFWT